MNNKSNGIIAILLISVILSSIMVFKVVKESMVLHIGRKDTPDAFLVSSTYTKTNDDGVVQEVIYTSSLNHFQDQDSTTFQKPNAYFTIKSGQKPWQLSADSGNSKLGLEIIHLVGNVKMYQAASENNKETTVTTEDATIYFNKKYAETDKLVTVKQPGVTAQSMGANVDFNVNVVNFLSAVKEVYIPKEAGNQSGQETAYLNADKATYDRNNHISSYFGNIQFSQGVSFLNADKLLVYDNKVDNSIEEIVAFGSPAKYSTIPTGKGEKVNAKADRIEYYPKKNIAVLIGNGELEQKGSKFSGPYITYDIAKKTITSTGQKCGKNCQQQGTTIVIQP